MFPAMKSGRGLPAAHGPGACPGIRVGTVSSQAFTGTPSVSGTPLEGRLASEAASGPVIVPGLVPGIVSAWCTGWGLGPRADLPVAAEHPARHPRVRARVLQGPHRTGADADHVVAVPDRIPGGLDPGHPGVPGSVPLVLLQHSRYAAPSPASSTTGGDHGRSPDSSSPRAATGQGYETTFY